MQQRGMAEPRSVQGTHANGKRTEHGSRSTANRDAPEATQRPLRVAHVYLQPRQVVLAAPQR
jgi:hypothetical protein